MQLAAAAVSHFDLTVASGRFPVKPPLPYVPGIDGAGRVLRSERFPSGTPVRIRGAGVGTTRPGTWSELAAVPDEALSAVPEGVDLTLAATFFSPCVTAHVAVHELGALTTGEAVAVTGASGAVGSIAVQLALRGGAGRVVGVIRRPESAAALPPGVEAVLAADGVDPVKREDGVDLLVDTVGGQGLAELALGALRPEGRVVLVGYTGGTEVTFELPSLLATGVRLIALTMIRWAPKMGGVADELLAALDRRELSLPRTAFPLDRLPEAIAGLRGGGIPGRLAVVPVSADRL